MSARKTLGIFASGFVVYGAVSACLAAVRSDQRPLLTALVEPVPAALADPGSRLKGVYLLGDDGSRDYQLGLRPWITPQTPNLGASPVSVFFDSQRNEECSFKTSADGKARCLPNDYRDYGAPIYQDAGCTEQVIAIPAAQIGCPQNVPKYAMRADTDAEVCSLTTGYYRMRYSPVGAFVGANLSPCYAKSNVNVCFPTNCTNQQGDFAYYSVGAEIDPVSFVGSNAMTDP
jgi:hypothetical protein